MIDFPLNPTPNVTTHTVGRKTWKCIGLDGTGKGIWDLTSTPDSFADQVAADKAAADQAKADTQALFALLPGASGAAQIGYLAPGVGASQRTVEAKLREVEINVGDYPNVSHNAMFAAARDAAGSGGVVRVKGGVYTLSNFAMSLANQVWLFDQNATINSSDAATTPAVLITGDGVKVRGGIWDNQAASGDAFAQVGCIKVLDADDVEVTSGSYKRSRGPCIDAYGTNRLRVHGNTFSDTWYAAVFVRPLNADIQGIEISGNRIINTVAFAGYDYGINVHNDNASLYKISDVAIFGNTIRFPVTAATDFPIPIEVYGGPNGSAGFVENISVTGNTVFGGGIGISLSQVQDGVASGNTVKSASRYGIEAVNPNNISITGNATYGGERGVSVSGAGTGVSVTGNSIRATTQAGVYASAVGERAIVSNNAISVASGAGVYMLSTSYFSITGNSLDGNGTGNKAVMLDKSDKCVVSGNTGSDWTQNGVLLFADTAVTLNRVICANNVWINTPNSLNLPTQLSNGGAIGSFVSYVGNFSDVDTSYRRDYHDALNNRVHFVGGGSPEAAFSAGVGSTYVRTDASAGVRFYVKESGSGNTGWVAK